MENYNISLDTGQEKINGNSYGEFTVSVVTLDKIKLTRISLENYNISCDTEGQSVWRITTSLLIMDNIKLNVNQYGELLFQFCLHKIKMNDEKTLNKIEISDNQHGWFTPAPVWLITI